jgi:hypothetical protein
MMADQAPFSRGRAVAMGEFRSMVRGAPQVTIGWSQKLAHRLRGRIPVHTKLGNGMKIKVHLNDHVGGAIIRTGYYEIDTVRLIEKLLKPGMVFFDVGTHVGQYSLLASKRVGSTGEVHGFEPDPETYRWLRQT